MHLDAGAVELVLERRLAQLREGVEHVVGGLGEHRLDRAEHLDAVAREARGALGERGMRDGPEVPGKHRGAAHQVRVQPRGAGHGFGDEPLERSLAQLTADEPEQELLFAFRRTPEQLAQQLCFRLRRPLPCRLRQPFQRPVHFSELERRRVGCALGSRDLQGGVPDADASLAGGSREKRDRSSDLVRSGALQESGEELDLREPATGLGDGTRGLDQVVEAHAPTAPSRSACSARSS